MSLSLLLGIGAIAAALGPRIKKEINFDNKVKYEGINNIPLTKIEKRAGVKKDKYGMYSHTDMKKMLKYGAENSTPKEFATFERRVNLVMNQQRRKKSEKLANSGIKSLPKERQDKVNNWIHSNGGYEPSDITEIVNIRRFFTPSNQNQMINDLMAKTWWGKCATSRPKIIRKMGENEEIWKMRVPLLYVNTFDSNYQSRLKRGYKRCLKDCGHNPKY